MMKSLIESVWLPVAFTGAVVAAAFNDADLSSVPGAGPHIGITAGCDTVIYRHDGYKRGWTEEDYLDFSKVTVIQDSSSGEWGEDESDTLEMERPLALDTLKAPDSLWVVDTFRYRYYAALRDSLCHVWVRDSLKKACDTLGYIRLDSLYAADSTLAAKMAFDAWYASLDRKARKKYDMEQQFPIIRAHMDSVADAKDSIKALKDSIAQARERILVTGVVPDSLMYKRFFTWTHETDFQKLEFRDYADTTFNYHYYSYPFQKEDVDASWLGVSGSPVQYFDFTRRGDGEGVFFYEAQESWSYSPETLPMYNTKTPYTELQYFGTAFTSGDKATDNLHLLTSQNITPSLNYTLLYNRFGGGGMLDRENTTNKTASIAANYLGDRYIAHSGYIYNMVSRDENGGITDNSWIRDTTVDAREIDVALHDARSRIKKKTLFLDQQYRIPFYFLLPEITDSTSSDDVTTAFIGHSTELSVYSRTYEDKLSSAAEKGFYDNTAYYNPTASSDSMRVRRFENKVYIRLQPWSGDAIVSKLDVGLGHKAMLYHTFDPTFLHSTKGRKWTSSYLYAGAEGQFKKYVSWNATAHTAFAGDEAGDFDVDADATLSIYPFRRHRKSPMTLGGHFSTSLEEPEYYQQHIYTNHYRWDNDFSKISSSRVSGTLAVPHWKFDARVSYSLLSNNLYYGTDGIIRQNDKAMSILTASARKDFTLWKIMHLDTRALLQFSSNESVVPLPMAAVSARLYVQFNIQKVLDLQLGGEGRFNTKWHAPAWNPALGVFTLQDEEEYGACPCFDVFLNAQWKRACIFVRFENVGMGWPMDDFDYFSAHHYIKTQRALKFGWYWPFYTQPQTTGGTIRPGSGSSSASGTASPAGAGAGRRIK